MEKYLKKHLFKGTFHNVPQKTSNTMSRIRGKNNKTTELKFKMYLIRNGISGFILNSKDLPGKPDFYFSKSNIAIFIDGCFWHGCPKCGHIPKTRSSFWKEKINRNKKRDKKFTRQLKNKGIHVIRLWEHQLNNKVYLENLIQKLRNQV